MHSGIVQPGGRHALNVEIEVRLLVPDLSWVARLRSSTGRAAVPISTASTRPSSAEVWVRLLPEAPSYARSSAEERCSAKAEVAGSSPAGRTWRRYGRANGVRVPAHTEQPCTVNTSPGTENRDYRAQSLRRRGRVRGPRAVHTTKREERTCTGISRWSRLGMRRSRALRR
jgi:hypothetical protein